jgi:endonuclease-8
MPEGPEIRKAADRVAHAIAGKFAIQVEFSSPKLKPWNSRLSGNTVRCIETHGKAMLTRFDNGLNIYSHNQLYGRWLCVPAGELPNTSRQLRLSIYTADQWALLYSASDIEILHDQELSEHPFLKKLGPDVLSTETTIETIIKRLLDRRFQNRQLGSFLTDQSFVAGLGNYLRCDILFHQRLHPRTKPSQLNPQQIKSLAESILGMPRQSYATEGITNDIKTTYKLVEQGMELEDARFLVFHREGKPCYRCGEKIQKQNIGGPCYLCVRCQTNIHTSLD